MLFFSCETKPEQIKYACYKNMYAIKKSLNVSLMIVDQKICSGMRINYGTIAGLLKKKIFYETP